MTSIGINIKKQRKRNKMTQQQLADKLGVSVMTIRRYESGATNLKINTIETIAKALGCSSSLLYGEDLPPLKEMQEHHQQETNKYFEDFETIDKKDLRIRDFENLTEQLDNLDKQHFVEEWKMLKRLTKAEDIIKKLDLFLSSLGYELTVISVDAYYIEYDKKIVQLTYNDLINFVKVLNSVIRGLLDDILDRGNNQAEQAENKGE